MGDVVKGLFGGGSTDNSEARKEAERSRREQQVANDRQLAEANRQNSKNSGRRRAPRGKRLFEDGPSNLTSKLGD